MKSKIKPIDKKAPNIAEYLLVIIWKIKNSYFILTQKIRILIMTQINSIDIGKNDDQRRS